MKHVLMIMVMILTLTVLTAEQKFSITDSYNAETAKNYTRSLEIMNVLATADPTDEFFQLRIGWLNYLNGKYNDALKSYQNSNRLGANLDAQIGILNCQLALGKWNDSLEQANEILKMYPQSTTVLTKAAYAAYMKQEYKMAADYYARYIKISPWDMEIRGYLLSNLYLAKDVMEAKKHYQKLKKYSPESAMVKEYAKVFE
ncbi:MAG: hypothetical protein CVU48_08320 [Candidatus Cloacimonetes bacterium HGW-Cloacimonetes-1]|nr:MAG: hypothetical protein CVU48_08320 [Candidatus Cloacimonetes bacterium HGW-Cloacimonetes-1]